MTYMIDSDQPGSTYQEAGSSQPHRIIKLTGEDGCSAEVRVTADWMEPRRRVARAGAAGASPGDGERAMTAEQAREWRPIETAPYNTEVLVSVDGHRGPAWSNRHCLVAYRNVFSGLWFEARHEDEDVIGVTHWMPLPDPPTAPPPASGQ